MICSPLIGEQRESVPPDAQKLIPLMIINALTGKPLSDYGDGANVRD